MKSVSTMYKLAKALAIAKGPRTIGKHTGAYILTTMDLMRLFSKEGFVVKKTDNLSSADSGPSWIRQINQWVTVGDVHRIPDGIAFLVGPDDILCIVDPYHDLINYCNENDCNPLLLED